MNHYYFKLASFKIPKLSLQMQGELEGSSFKDDDILGSIIKVISKNVKVFETKNSIKNELSIVSMHSQTG